jgi:hypothetical protein
MRYQASDVLFDVPDSWLDRTVTAFSAPLKPNQRIAPNIVLTRDLAGDREDAAKYADRQLVELARNLAGFDLEERRQVQVGGLPGVELLFTWSGQNGTIRQKQTFVLTKGRKLLTFVATAAKDDFAAMEPQFAAILASTKFQSGS